MSKLKLVAFFICVILFHLATITIFPIAKNDESWMSSDAYSVVNKNFIPISFPFYQQSVRTPLVLYILLGQMFNIFGLGLFQGRILALFIAVVLLIVQYLFAKEFFGKKVAFWSIVYMASTRAFFLSGHYIRTDVMPTLLIILSLWIFLKNLKKFRRQMLFLSGFLISSSIDIHPNGGFFLVSLIATCFLTRTLSKKILFYFLFGSFSYFVYYFFAHVFPIDKTFTSEYGYAFFSGHPIPILSMPLWQTLLSEMNRYSTYFLPTRIHELILIIMAIVYSLRRKDFPIRFIAVFTIIAALLFIPFSSSKTEFYLFYFFPIFSIMLSYFIFNIRVESIKYNLSLILQRVLLLTIIVNFLVQLFIVSRWKNYNYMEVNPLISYISNNNSFIVGPSRYWLSLTHFKYRSIDVLVFYKVFENKNLEEAFKTISPNYLIIDDNIDYSFDGVETSRSNSKINKRELDIFLEKYAFLIKDYRSEFYGNIRVYKIDFDNK